MHVIMESGFIAATSADLLTSTRLQTAPGPGVILFQVQASDNDATNNYKMDLQLPDGSVPLIAQDVPMGPTAGLAGSLDERFMLQYAAVVDTGGRVVFALTEAGDAECAWRATFTPYTGRRRR